MTMRPVLFQRLVFRTYLVTGIRRGLQRAVVVPSTAAVEMYTAMYISSLSIFVSLAVV